MRGLSESDDPVDVEGHDRRGAVGVDRRAVGVELGQPARDAAQLQGGRLPEGGVVDVEGEVSLGRPRLERGEAVDVDGAVVQVDPQRRHPALR